MNSHPPSQPYTPFQCSATAHMHRPGTSGLELTKEPPRSGLAFWRSNQIHVTTLLTPGDQATEQFSCQESSPEVLWSSGASG